MRISGLVGVACLLASVPPVPLAAQGSAASVSDSSPFRPLALPAPSVLRTGAGRPGAHYWQQRADYRLNATLDPARNEIRGRGTIHYVNKSPDALPYLWLFVEQNLSASIVVTTSVNHPSGSTPSASGRSCQSSSWSPCSA